MNDSFVSAPPDASDIPIDGWIDRWMPRWLRPYLRLARLDRPIGTWLLLLPCWWGLAMATGNASGGWPDWRTGLLFTVGALVMRGAGCTVNDLADRRIDGKVGRTAKRPIASGAVSVTRGVLFLALQLAMGFWVLVHFNAFTIKLGVASLALVAIYPFMKRVTYWPQLWLGLTFNWGALIGWSAVQGGLGLAPGLLYAAGILWTLGYDTIYAHQDKEDDLIAGVKSSALALGANTKPWLMLFYVGAIILIGGAGEVAGLAWPFYSGLALGAAHLVWQVARVDIDRPLDCLATFKSNRDFGLIILAGIIAARVLEASG
jgi:4-hydroxybenzoate polyprenyltransferase